MPNWMKLTGAWFLGALVAVAFSWGAVAQVRSRVIEPSIEIPATVVAAASTTTQPGATTQPTVIQVEPEIGDTTSTSTTTQQTETTTITQPATTTSQLPSTTSPPATEISSHPLLGGVVTIRHSPGVVEFVSAIPRPGFTTDVEEAGPGSVRVEFESDTHTSDFRAEWKDGDLRIVTNESDDD